MHYLFSLLPCGLRIVHLPTTSPVSYIGYAINAGTRDEKTAEYGMAHFVEHMLFKGTDKRRAWHILNRMERVGGELNAYTSKEETVVYSIFPHQHTGRALELLTNIVQESQFPESEVEKEREVILDEMNSYIDTPSELIYDEFENHLFAQHAMGHNILGETTSVSGFTGEQGRNFLTQCYTPNRMVLFSMGSHSYPHLVRQAEKYWQAIAASSEPQRTPPSPSVPFRITASRDTHQAHVVMGTTAYHLHDARRHALFLLNNMLGGPGMNSRLNLLLRERHGYVYQVESSLNSYTDTGVLAIYFGCDHKNSARCIELIERELRLLGSKAPSTIQLHRAKQQLMGQLNVSTDNKESIALGIGKSFLHFNKYDTLEEVNRRIDSLTAPQLLEAANEILSPEGLSLLHFSV